MMVNSKPQTDMITEQLKGTHTLRQIGQHTETSQTSSASFFLISENFSSNSSADTKVTFSWQGNDKVYRFFTIPLSRVRIRLDDTVTIPYVYFNWNGLLVSRDANEGDVNYVVVTCSSKDWPVNIQIPVAR